MSTRDRTQRKQKLNTAGGGKAKRSDNKTEHGRRGKSSNEGKQAEEQARKKAKTKAKNREASKERANATEERRKASKTKRARRKQEESRKKQALFLVHPKGRFNISVRTDARAHG